MNKGFQYTLVALTTLTAMLSISCKKQSEYKTIDGFVQGTTYHIVYRDNGQITSAQKDIESLLADFDTVFSNYVNESLVVQLNASERPDTIALNPWFKECFKTSMEVSQQTDGCFDITLKPLIDLNGFGAKHNNATQHQADQKVIDSLLEQVGYRKIVLTQNAEGHTIVKRLEDRVQVDFNAIAQGYSVDVVAKWFEEQGIEDYMVEIGGEIYCRGTNAKGLPWRVGIDKPTDGNVMPGKDLQTVLSITGRGLATSGNYREFNILEDGSRVSHTIDPKTGRSTTHNLLSATIIAPTAALADGYATACMVMGVEGSKKFLADHPHLEGYLIYSTPDNNFEVYMTESIRNRIITAEQE